MTGHLQLDNLTRTYRSAPSRPWTASLSICRPVAASLWSDPRVPARAPCCV